MSEKLPSALLASSPELAFTQEELHSRLVHVASDLEYDRCIDRPEVAIVNDETICIGTHEIGLTRSQRFMFNVLRINQGYTLGTRDIIDTGYELTDRNFYFAANSLMASIATASNDPIIEVSQTKTGFRQNTYTLLPEVEVTDFRSEEGTDARHLRGRKYAQVDKNGIPQQNAEGVIAFHGRTARQKATVEMLRELRGESLFNRRPDLFLKGVGQRVLHKSILPVLAAEELTIEHEMELLWQKERALLLYLQKSTFTDEETSVLHAGIDAYDTLFAHNIDLAAANASKCMAAGDPRAYDELYQRSAESLLATIAKSYPEPGLKDLVVRPLAAFEIRRTLAPAGRAHGSSPVSIHVETVRKYFQAAKQSVEVSGSIDVQEVGRTMDLSTRSILAIQAALAERESLDELQEQAYTPSSVVEECFVDEELDRLERADALARLMEHESLVNVEKIVLSLYYGVYSPHLRAAEVTDGRSAASFQYPLTQEAFDALTRAMHSLEDVASALNRSVVSVLGIHKRALYKSRVLLQDDPLFDTYGRISPRQLADEEIERQEIIERALAISPGKALTENVIEKLKEGTFPTISRISYLFGSTHNFQQACGFDPDPRSVMRMMTNQEIIQRCRKANPDHKPARGKVLYELQATGVAPSRTMIRHRFGSLDEFNRQCGFET